jgi:hypothetical protein
MFQGIREIRKGFQARISMHKDIEKDGPNTIQHY